MNATTNVLWGTTTGFSGKRLKGHEFGVVDRYFWGETFSHRSETFLFNLFREVY